MTARNPPEKSTEQDTKTNLCFPFSGNSTRFITRVGLEAENTHYLRSKQDFFFSQKEYERILEM